MTPTTFLLLVSPLLMAPKLLKEQFEAPKALLLLVTGYALAFTVSAPMDLLTTAACAWPIVFLAACLMAREKMIGIVGAAGSFDGLLHQIAYVLIFLTARSMTLDDILVPVTAATVIVCSYAALQVAGRDPIAWDRGMSTLESYVRPSSTLGHPNHVGAYLAMAAPFILSWGTAWRLGLVAVLAGIVGATVSRAAWAGLAAGVATYAALIGWGPEAGLAAGVGLVALNLTLDSPLRRATRARLRSFFRLGNDERAHFYPVIWRIVRKHLVFGVGPENLAQSIHREARQGEIPNVLYLRAHCEPLHVLVTTGVVGSLVAGAFVVLLCVAGFEAYRTDPRQAAPAIASLVAFAVSMLPGFRVVPVMVLASVCAGLLARG